MKAVIAMEHTGQTSTDTIAPPSRTETGRGSARLILMLHGAAPMEPSVCVALSEFDEITIGRGSTREFTPEKKGKRRTLRIQLADHAVSTRHARLTCEEGEWICEDLESKNGTVIDGASIRQAKLIHGSLLEVGRHFFRFSITSRGGESDAIVSEGELDAPVPDLATFDPALAAAFASLAEAANHDVNVLLTGATGTGKEVVARAFHQLSGRPGDLVVVHLPAISDTLVMSELFGCVRGAFSGAESDRPGLVHAADKGTLFLDEFGDQTPAVQAALLRVIQQRVVTPLGATKPNPVDIRVVAATHRNLHEMVEQGRFREDLLARVEVFKLRLPTLQERKDDLGLLLRAVVRRMPALPDPFELTQAAARALLLHDWPSNVRGLEAALKAAIATVRDRPIDLKDLPSAVQQALSRPVPPAADAPSSRSSRGVTKEKMITLLREHGGNIAAVAKSLGKERVQIYRWIKKFEIDLKAF
jgi:DNA-binding NtrC family response regulator